MTSPPGQSRRAVLGTAGGLVGAAVWACWTARPRGPPADGRIDLSPFGFPGLPVVALDGSPEVLPSAGAQLRVLNLWARWCGPCRRELPSLDHLAQRLAQHGIATHAVALDDDGFALREYLRDLKLAALQAWRLPAPSWPRELTLTSLPQTWVLGRRANVLARIAGARDWDDGAWLTTLIDLDRRDRDGGKA